MNIFEAVKQMNERRAEEEKLLAQANAQLAAQEAVVDESAPDIKSMPETEVVDDFALPEVELNDQQNAGVAMMRNHKYGILVGYAGTGKTTTAKAAVRAIENQLETRASDCAHIPGFPGAGAQFAIVAYTGMAVKQIRRSVGTDYGRQCATIHKLLDYGPVEEEHWPTKEEIAQGANPTLPIIRKMMRPRRNADNPLDLDALLIDEISMLGSDLFEELLAALPERCRIYGIGDVAQLPPVFGTPIMPFLMKHWPVVELTQVYRQKEGDMVANAHRIRNGEKPVASENFRMLAVDKEVEKAQAQFIHFITKEYREGRYDPLQDIILSANNVSPVGQELLNILLRPVLNPDRKMWHVKTMRQTKHYSIGDRVMATKNVPDKGIYNGLLGWIEDIYPITDEARAADVKASDATIEEDTLLSVMQEIDDKQAKEREARKLASMLGEDAARRLVGVSDEPEDEDGTAKRTASHGIVVRFDGLEDPVVLETSSQIENLIPAWVVTVHKSQGSGFRNVYILLHNYASKLLTNELLYTAVTRCQDNVCLLSTNFAFAKALNRRVIDGASIAEKVAKYIAAYANKVTKDPIYIPEAEEL